jgi:hypothetical protein
MDPQARTRLAAACHRYLAAQPWKLVGDDYLFGLHDRTGDRYGCAAVMGGAGIEFGLDVSLGEKGFTLLQKLLDEEMDYSTLKAKSSSITFSITDVAPASRAFKKAEPMLIEKKKVRAPKHGYLTGWRLVPGQEPRPLDSEEAFFLARCLEAVAELVETGRLGKEPNKDGTRTIFFNLTDEGGKLAIRQSYRRLDEADVAHPKVKPSPELMEKLKKRPRIDGRYLLSIFTPPATVQGGILWMALMLDERERPILAHAEHSFEAAALTVFEAFGGKLSIEGAPVGVPKELWTDSFPTFEALKDAMLDLEVRFVSKERIRELELKKHSLSDHLSAG